MPKRIPTPPPADDEPRYLTVVYPFAISGTCNMELPKDRQDFARWVACCVDKDAFFAIFHKPSSRGMVIIEVNRDYRHFDAILGEHRWSEFLHKPTEEEEGRVTQVFYCTYSTGRIVQKNGWKRIDVDETWFKAWSPKNKQIKFPYPPTHFCDVPVEDRTNHSLCRPLPGAVIIPPVVEIAAPQPVVGSAAWIQKKESGASIAPITAQSKPNTLGAWGKGVPKVHTAQARPGPAGSVKKIASVPQAPLVVTRLPAIGGGPIAVKSSNVWQSKGKKSSPPPVATNWEESPPVSRENTPISPVIANQGLAAPPGLPARKNAWASSATSYPTHPPSLVVPSNTASGAPDRAANLSAASWGSNSASISSPDSDSGPDLTTATESDNPFAVHIHFSESMEEEFHGMGIRDMPDDGDLRELDSIAPTWDDQGPAAWDTNAAWDDGPMEAEDIWKQNQTTANQILCNAHGIICKKGICAEYAKQLRNAKRADELEKRKAATTNKGKKGARSKGHGAGKKNNENEPIGRNTTQNNQFRGPGAPVKTNWRGAPRNIVDADAIEKRETVKDVSDDGWGHSDSEFEPNAAAVVPAGLQDAESEASWGIPDNAYDPWAEPATKANHPSSTKPLGKKKPVSSNWADEVDAELAAGGADGFSTVSSKRSSKRGGSTTSWGTRSSFGR